ncbi:MAG TPA: SCO family protein, partial [Mesorhizobium sp.]
SVLLLNSKGDFAGTIAYGENPKNAVAKLTRLAAEG